MKNVALECVVSRRHGWRPRPAKSVSNLGFPALIFVLGACLASVGPNFLLQPAMAADQELVDAPICSAATAAQFPNICTVTSLGNGQNKIKINLTAASASIDVGGYKVVTENYNGNYLTPVVEALPGDTVAAHLVNALPPASPAAAHAGMQHGDPNDNPTNLHYFHGGIVSPKNAVRPKPGDPETGNGDNVYIHLKSGLGADGKPNSFDFDVQIPGDQMLDARVLEGTGYISHPVGLNWYHSHMHGISSDQVAGGMSGLISVGEAMANVKAACVPDPSDARKCLNDVEKDTRDLHGRTKARYAILRDIAVKNLTKLPGEANGDPAVFDPEAGPFLNAGLPCGVWNKDTNHLDLGNAAAQIGFCQRTQDTAFLYTVNGQRFPTITVEAGQNLLLRTGNLSSNLPYWLELQGADGTDGKVLPLTLLSIDGVVPAAPVVAGQSQKPVLALNDNNLLLMPAARAEIYVRNDEKPHTERQVYILRTKTQKVSTETWPEIQLARIVLEPNAVASKTLVSLNVPVAKIPLSVFTEARLNETAAPPVGCVRDLDPAFHEYRRVTFLKVGSGAATSWSLRTELIRPQGTTLSDDATYKSADPDLSSIPAGSGGGGMPFEEYVGTDGLVDWTKPHPCIQIDHGTHRGSHKQLWVLFNGTTALHNFHIHQIKFRLATKQDLADHFLAPPDPSHTCTAANCAAPDYAFYDDGSSNVDPGATRWHDTIPLPPFRKVYVVMSFDAKQQIGRFVFHCHLLAHEDKGLMAPIEVWEPQAVSQLSK